MSWVAFDVATLTTLLGNSKFPMVSQCRGIEIQCCRLISMSRHSLLMPLLLPYCIDVATLLIVHFSC